MRKMRRSDLLNTYGIELPIGKHKVYRIGDEYKIYSIKDDTEGCILVGAGKAGDSITKSRIAFDALYSQIRDAIEQGESVWIEIK